MALSQPRIRVLGKTISAAAVYILATIDLPQGLKPVFLRLTCKYAVSEGWKKLPSSAIKYSFQRKIVQQRSPKTASPTTRRKKATPQVQSRPEKPSLKCKRMQRRKTRTSLNRDGSLPAPLAFKSSSDAYSAYRCPSPSASKACQVKLSSTVPSSHPSGREEDRHENL
ncbi:hypothetical protein TcWFU_000665 [Taenia crassiceps]|uniref:Uncharacterized protein n=1 Tax=Taenia crassiceps TaxID=6207 RepID=A0ABR4QJZ4_9CEST